MKTFTKIMRKNLEFFMAVGMLLIGMLTLAWADGGFRFFGPRSRVFTPNGFNNKSAIFCFDNPSGSGVEGRIYTLLGALVSDLGSQPSSMGAGAAGCPQGILGQAYSMSWDGRSNGNVVTSGVYIYQIRAEGLSFTGALLVVR